MTYAVEKRYDEAALLLKTRFSEYVDLVADDGPLAARYPYDPYVFGGDFPALGVSKVSSSGPPNTQRSRLPGQMLFAVRVYDVSLSRAGQGPSAGWEDARDQAERRTDEVHGLWREAFDADREIRKKVGDWYVESTESGDMDSLGRSRRDETRGNILWVHRALVVVQF